MLKHSLLSLLAIFSTPFFATTIQSSICVQVTAPVFTTQNSTTAAATATLAGTTSQNVSIVIKNNAQQVATVTSDSAGDFSLQVSLTVGTNSFTATGTNNCGDATSATPVVITRSAPVVVQPPEQTPAENSPAEPTEAASTTTESESTNTTAATPQPDETVIVAPQTVDKSDTVPLEVVLPAGAQSKTVGSGANAKTTVFTTEKTVYIKGTTTPLAAVTISNNNVKVASLTAASDGSFGVAVPLTGGTNILTIEASIGGITTTQILTYIRTEDTNPAFIIASISVIAILMTAGIVLAIRTRHPKITNP